MAEETVVKGFTKAEIRRCFGDGVLNKNGVPIYIVHNTKKIDGRYCHVGFVARTKNDPSRLQMNPTSYDGMEEVSCELKALACLRPEAAKRIARQFKMAIDPSPIPKPATQSH